METSTDAVWVGPVVMTVATLTLSVVISGVVLLQKPSKLVRTKLAPPSSQHRLVVQRLLDNITARENVKGRGMRVVLLAVGTRGDVQPCLALAIRLKDRGHFPLIISAKEFKTLIEINGIECATIQSETIEHPDGWDAFPSSSELLAAAYQAPKNKGEWKANGDRIFDHCCRFQPDLILTTHFGELFAGDIAEKMNVPWWGLRVSPDIPSSSIVSSLFATSSYAWVNSVRNIWQKASIGFVFWRGGILDELSQFRTRTLGLPPISTREKRAQNECTPLLLGFSPSIIEPPVDTKSWHVATGFWLLNSLNGWKPNKALRAFFEKPGKCAPLCIDFGSNQSKDFIERCVRAVRALRKRAVVRTSLNFRSRSNDVLYVSDVPHIWLLPRCSVVIHHGGAGTTGRILASGVPSIVIPHLQWTDQSLWAEKIESLGVGVHVQRENPGVSTIQAAVETILENYISYTRAAKLTQEMIHLECQNSLDATVDLIESPLRHWAPEVALTPGRCPVEHSISRRKRASVQVVYKDVRLLHERVVLPEDPLENKPCRLCRFLVPLVYELITLLMYRLFIRVLVLGRRWFCCFRPTFPQSIEAFQKKSFWKNSLLLNMGIIGRVEDGDSVQVSSRALAVDEGFTSCLYLCEAMLTSANFVLKMSPQWSVAGQVTSAEQLQHTKEMWVGRRSRGAGGGMGCLVPYTWSSSTCPLTGEFLHAMEFLGGMTAGNQLEDLPLMKALQAVGEIAKLHSLFWERCPADWQSSFETLAYGRRIVAVLGKHYFNIQKGATTQFRYDPYMMGPLDAFLFNGPTTVIHGDLRSANVMFPNNNLDKNARCCIIDWGGLMRGKGVFDVAYLLGTGMSSESRRKHEMTVLQHYYSELDVSGANLLSYSFDQLVRDYRICLWLSAALYAIPEIYDRGTLSEDNEAAADQVRRILRKNLQPVLDEEVVYTSLQ